MKKSIACFALFTCLGLTAYAAPQEASAPVASAPSQGHKNHLDPNRQVQRMTKKLNLTADQQQQLLPVLSDRNQQVQAILQDSSLSKKDRHQKMIALREDTQNKIKAVLTPDQKNAYDAMLQNAREHHRDRKSQNPGGNASSN